MKTQQLTIENSGNSLAYAYLTMQAVNTLSFYLSTVTPLELAEVAACGAITGYSKAQGRQEKKQILGAKTLDEIFEQTLIQQPELQPLVNAIEKHCLEVYESQRQKLEKGVGELSEGGSIEDSFLALHKLNFAAIDRFFTSELLRDKNNHQVKDILTLKNSLTAGIITAAATMKEGSLRTGEVIGSLLYKMQSYLSPEEIKSLNFMIEELSKVAKQLSPVTYLAYQTYKIGSKFGRVGMKAALLPIDATVVAASGFLEGITKITRNDKKSDLHTAYNFVQGQNWYEASKTLLSSTTGLCSDILHDWQTSYNLAVGKREKFISAMDEGLEQGITLKPHKKGAELLFYSIVAGQALGEKNSWLVKPVINFGTAITATFRATLGTSAKYIFKAAQQAGQVAGEIIKFTNQKQTEKHL